ncbi:TPA: hypothetical protein ACH3X1_009098 [Trebouxia sp. C0004]
MSIIDDTLGTPLFDARMAALHLPMSAVVQSIAEYPGESITDQIGSVRPHHRFPVWQTVLIVVAASLGFVAMVLSAVVWRKKQQQQQSGMDGLASQASLELQNCCTTTAVSLTPWHQNKNSASLLDHVQQLWRQSDQPIQRATSQSAAGLITAKSADLLLDARHSLEGLVNNNSLPWSANNLPLRTSKSLINPSEIQICFRPDGQAWVLGAGTYGTVYKARRGSQDVAVKTLNVQALCPGGSASHDWRSLQKELRLHERLSQNRNLVQFWGHCVKQGCIYLVLELMEGGDLRQALQSSEGKQQLQWYKKGSVIALDIIKGLHFLHSHSVLHRDLKSGNVLLSKSFDVAKVCDIGLSHIMGNTSGSPPAAQATFAYAAPEMLLNLRWLSFSMLNSVPQECPQEVADLVEGCLDLCADKRPTADDIIGVIEQSAQLNSSVEG